jgi:hypothetical protein
MIPRLRNRGILQLTCGLALTVAFIATALASRRQAHRISDERILLLILLYFASVIMWMVGSFTLARAKGHGRDTIGGIFLFLLLLGFCVPIAPFVFPGVVIFGLKDRTRERSRWHQ